MARTKSQLLHQRKEKERGEWYEGHQKYLKNTSSFRKFGGVPDSQGKVYHLESNPKGKALQRKINSPKAKAKRSLRHYQYEGNLNNWGVRTLAKLNKK